MYVPNSISSSAQYVILHKKNWVKKGQNIRRFGSGNWFCDPLIAHFATLAKVKGAATTLCNCRKECNKYDLTAAQCFSFSHHNNWSRWFAITSLPFICCPSFSFTGGAAKK
jgi:hypothetical protein